MNIVEATQDDSAILTEITKKSKAYWEYSEEQIEKWSDVLTITPAHFENHFVYILIVDNKKIGYYSYLNLDETTIRLDYFFVLPEFIGHGYGKALISDFLNRLKNTEIKEIIVDADPNAEEFYVRSGFTKILEKESTIKGRFLPVLQLKL